MYKFFYIKKNVQKKVRTDVHTSSVFAYLIYYLPLDKAIVHSCGSTVYKRPSYLMSAFEIRLIFEPNSGNPLLMFESNCFTV